MKPLDKKAKEHVNDLTPLLDVSFMDKEECVNYQAELSYKAGYLEGRQDALRECVEICETYEKRSNYTWANGGYSEHDFINEGMIRMAKLLNSEIQSLMQQFNNEGEMKCRKS